MTNRFLRTTLAASAFALAACSSGDSLGPAIELTEAETADMMEALDAITAMGETFQVRSAAMRANLVAARSGAALLTLPIDETEECPLGGTIRITGSATTDDFITGSANIKETFNNCAGESTSGTVWTFNNSLQMVMTATGTASSSTATGTLNGTLKVSSSAGSGSCVVSINYTDTSDDNGYSYTATGTVCGEPYSESDSGSW